MSRRLWIGLSVLAFTASAVLGASPRAGAAEPELKSPCFAEILGSLGAAGGDDAIYTADMVFERPPAQVAAFVATPRAPSIATLSAIPTDASEYRAAFGVHAVSQSETAQLAKARTIAQDAGLLGKPAVRDRKQFQAFLKRTDANFVLVSGHNSGGQFVFAGGATESLPILAEDCARLGKLCVFISCNSKDYLRDGAIGVGRPLTLPEGLWITQKVSAWLASQPHQVSAAQLVAFVRATDAAANLRYHASYFAVGACAAAGTSAAAYVIIEGASPARR